MGSRHILAVFTITLVGSWAIAGAPVPDTMLNAQVRDLISKPRGYEEIEKARFECLRLDTDQPVAWKDPNPSPKHDIAGTFKVLARYKNKTKQQCRDYEHRVTNRNGEPIISTVRGKPMRFVNTVCWTGKQWEIFEGDRADLKDETPAPLAPSGDTGPEHRHTYPNMVAPQDLGQILDVFKDAKMKMDEETTEARKEVVRASFYAWLPKLAEQLKGAQRTLALDQLLILIAKVDTDTDKLKVIAELEPRLVQIGDATKKKTDAKNIANLIKDRTMRVEVDRAFAQLPETRNSIEATAR